MKPIARPTENAMSLFLDCVAGIRDQSLRSRLQSIAANVDQDSTNFDQLAAIAATYTIPPQVGVAAIVTTEEMSKVYNRRMARKGAPGRQIYDALMIAALHGRCPLCGQGAVRTLDHYLPKTSFPSLAVTPTNLVPACADCNHLKGERYATHQQNQMIHPYFDDISMDNWLKASVLETSPPGVQFSVLPPIGWPATLSARLRNHFDVLKLGRTYSSYAGEELSGIRDYLVQLHGHSGADGVKSYLQEQAASRSLSDANSWQSVTYNALANSDWYCNGGFV